MLSKAEQLRIREEIVTYLREVQRFADQDIFNRYPFAEPGDMRTIRLLLWEAREVVRVADGIDFGPVRGWPGTFERKEWSQIETRALRQRAKGTRAHRRAEQRLRLASELAPDSMKERLSDAADRVALRLAMRAAKT